MESFISTRWSGRVEIENEQFSRDKFAINETSQSCAFLLVIEISDFLNESQESSGKTIELPGEESWRLLQLVIDIGIAPLFRLECSRGVFGLARYSRCVGEVERFGWSPKSKRRRLKRWSHGSKTRACAYDVRVAVSSVPL